MPAAIGAMSSGRRCRPVGCPIRRRLALVVLARAPGPTSSDFLKLTVDAATHIGSLPNVDQFPPPAFSGAVEPHCGAIAGADYTEAFAVREDQIGSTTVTMTPVARARK